MSGFYLRVLPVFSFAFHRGQYSRLAWERPPDAPPLERRTPRLRQAS